MTAKTSTGAIPFEFGQSKKNSRTPSPRRPSGKSFNLLTIGNFTGNSILNEDGATNSDGRYKPLKIDRDNLEDVMAKLRPSLSIPITQEETPSQGNTVNITFRNLDDFHPDRIFDEVELFAEFRTLRRKLKKDSTFDAAAEKMNLWLSSTAPPEKEQPSTPTPAHTPSEGLLDSILGGNDSTAPKSEADTLVNSLIQDAVAAYATPASNPNKQYYIDTLDQTISRTMAAILHHADFQSLESAWRGLDMLTRRVETDSKLTLRMLSIDKQTLLVDLATPQDATQSSFAKLINDATPLPNQEDRWSAILGLYDFSNAKNDALMLGILAKVMAHADTPFIAAGEASLVNSRSFFYQPDPSDWQSEHPEGFKDTWHAIRKMPETQYIALSSPRFLVRYPYGKKSQRIESFNLEETDSSFKAEHFLWCNGAIAHGIGLCQSFSQQHWNMSLGDVNTLERLPLAFYDDDDEQCQIPTAEVFLSQSAFDTITDAGLAPLISVKGSDHLQLGPLISIYHQRQPLKGPWE
ncbi:hypothetical protein A9Q99_16440 [Gammaproteobacteria bacterium 45_16_T64]|nr:hypothetical protein A9Q99_16440 [Gammaproteobacteria bacterium 45_16_T64]